jgi:hypothetical protein
VGSITSWSRLEPQSLDAALGSLAAKTADPLWMLARQWQFGEWQGEDSGSAVDVAGQCSISPLTRYVAGNPAPGGIGAALSADRPIESVVEGEGAALAIDRRVAALAGRRFLDAIGPSLAARYESSYVQRYGVAALTAEESASADERTRGLAALLAGRALNGLSLRAELAPSIAAGALPALPAIDPADRAAVTAAAKLWLEWCDRRFGTVPSEAWQPERLSYRFTVAAPTSSSELMLSAPDHRGGRVDWTTFDVKVGGSIGAGRDPGTITTPITALPTGIAFPGMPAARWWQFENQRADFGRLDAAPDDLGRLLLAEFALVYGNDFFGLPLTIPVGCVCRITHLQVSTTFGETVAIPNAAKADGPAAGRWRMFHIADGTPDKDGGAGWLVVPASAVDVQESEAIEDVLFSRDETANMAWAIERRVTGPSGLVMERREAYHRSAAMPVPPSGTPKRTYVLATSVPPHWLPLVPVANVPGRVRLELRGPHAPLGRLLSAASFALASEELPRVGRLVTRHDRRSRWADGTTHLWTGKRVRPGRGEGSAGLKFDEIVDGS